MPVRRGERKAHDGVAFELAFVDAATEVQRRSLERVGLSNRLCEAAHRAYDKRDGR